MELAGAIAIGAVIIVGTILQKRRMVREMSQGLRPVAESCGLSDVKTSVLRLEPGVSLEAGLGDLRVRMATVAQRNGKGQPTVYRTDVCVLGGGRELVPLGLQRETARTSDVRKFGRDIDTGDFDFDDDFYVTGPPTLVHAVLDAETRRRLRQLLTLADLEAVDGTLRATTVAERPDKATTERILRQLLDVAERIRRPADVAARLAQNAQTELIAWVRQENLLALVREYPGDPRTEQTLLSRCADPSDHVRVRAAAALGPRGRDTLLEIADRSGADDGSAARAIAFLGRHLPVERAKAILNRALRERHVQTARACLLSLASFGDADALGLLVKVMQLENGELAVAAAQALGRTALPAAEAPLVAALTRDVPGLPAAAAEALGEAGSMPAILPLKEAEARHGRDAEVRRAARQAVARIQSRAGGATPGQLSLSSVSEGSLSLAEDERGRVSLTRTEAPASAPRAPRASKG